MVGFESRLKADDVTDNIAHPNRDCRREFRFDVAAVMPLVVGHSHTWEKLVRDEKA